MLLIKNNAYLCFRSITLYNIKRHVHYTGKSYRNAQFGGI